MCLVKNCFGCLFAFLVVRLFPLGKVSQVSEFLTDEGLVIFFCIYSLSLTGLSVEIIFFVLYCLQYLFQYFEHLSYCFLMVIVLVK